MRRNISKAELISWMNEQLHIDGEHPDCRFTSVYTLAEEDSEGVNWSTPFVRCSGVSTSTCSARVREIELEARRKFNLKPE